MRFLLLNQFCPPRVAPTGQYLHDLPRSLVQRGHQIKVLCSRRSYNDTKTFPARECAKSVQNPFISGLFRPFPAFSDKIADYTSFYALLTCALLFERPRRTPPQPAALEFARGNFLRSASYGRFIELLEDGNKRKVENEKPKTRMLKTVSASLF